MLELPARYERNARLFGRDGQRKLCRTDVVIVGVSGLGSPLAQQIALLGVRRCVLIDPQDLDETNRNRFIGARPSDPVPGSPKVNLAARMIREINPEVAVTSLAVDLVSEEAFKAIRESHWVFGCFDHDGPRFILNETCAAYERSYIDLATDTHDDGAFGGRICLSRDGFGCLYCLSELDMDDVRDYLSSETEREKLDAIYGVSRDVLDETGPSVAPLNTVIAAQAAVEFMVAVTGMRDPTRLIKYRGDRPIMTTSGDAPLRNCPYCKEVRGAGTGADVERYLRMPHLRAA